MTTDHFNRRTLLWRAAAAGIALPSLGASTLALGQANRGVTRMIIGFPVGGGVDASARPVAQQMAGHYPGGLVVEAKAGATSRIAVDYVKNSPPDGTTMLFTPDFALTIFPHSYRKLSYDPVKDFAPVAMCGRSSMGLCVGPMVGEEVKTVNDLVAWFKAHPQQASYASTGAGGTPHFVGLLFAKAINLPLVHVPYKGGAPGIQDIMGGQIAMGFNPLSEALPQLAGGSGKLRVLATTGTERTPLLPNAPTMIEAGYKDVVSSTWMGVFLPAGTPQSIVNETAANVNEALRSQMVKDSYFRLGSDVIADSTPESTAAAVKADIAKWGPVVKASGFTADD